MTEIDRRIGTCVFFEWTDGIKYENGHGETTTLESVHEIDTNDLFEITSGGNIVEIEPCEGWFYQTVFPGCLPECDPIGPFDSIEDAMEDAVDNGFIEDDSEVELH
jgi:hypothetical protein